MGLLRGTISWYRTIRLFVITCNILWLNQCISRVTEMVRFPWASSLLS